jgi:uncharacterized membrane protein YfcA
MSLGYWYIFPLAVAIAVVAMSSGISGSNFWIPVYIIGLGIDPQIGFWMALLTMLFGFGSGLARNLLQGTIDPKVALAYLRYIVPGAILGSLLAPYSPTSLLIALFAAFVLLYGSYMIISSSRRFTPRTLKGKGARAFLAGLLKGLIATGTGKLLLPCIMSDKDIGSPADAVGTTVLVVFIVNLVAVSFRLTPEFVSDLVEAENLGAILLFVIPGVIIGGQLGPAVASRLSAKRLRMYVGVLLILVSGLMALRAMSLA